MASSIVTQLEQALDRHRFDEAVALVQAKRTKLRHPSHDNPVLGLWLGRNGRRLRPRAAEVLPLMLAEGLDPNWAPEMDWGKYRQLPKAAQERLMGPEGPYLSLDASLLVRATALSRPEQRHAMVRALLDAGAVTHPESDGGPWVQAARRSDMAVLSWFQAATPREQWPDPALLLWHIADGDQGPVTEAIMGVRQSMGPVDEHRRFPVGPASQEHNALDRAIRRKNVPALVLLWNAQSTPILSETQREELWVTALNDAAEYGVEQPLLNALLSDPRMVQDLDLPTTASLSLPRHSDLPVQVQMPLRERIWQPLHPDALENEAGHAWSVHQRLQQHRPYRPALAAGGLGLVSWMSRNDDLSDPMPMAFEQGPLTHGQIWALRGWAPFDGLRQVGMDVAAPHPMTGERPVVLASAARSHMWNHWFQASGGWTERNANGDHQFGQLVRQAVRTRDIPLVTRCAQALSEHEIPDALLSESVDGMPLGLWCQSRPELAQAWTQRQGRWQTQADEVPGLVRSLLLAGSVALLRDTLERLSPEQKMQIWRPDGNRGQTALDELLLSPGTAALFAHPKETQRQTQIIECVTLALRHGASWPEDTMALRTIADGQPRLLRQFQAFKSTKDQEDLKDGPPFYRLLIAWGQSGWSEIAWSVRASHQIISALEYRHEGRRDEVAQALNLSAAPQSVLQDIAVSVLNPARYAELWTNDYRDAIPNARLVLDTLVRAGADLSQPLAGRYLPKWLSTWTAEGMCAEVPALKALGMADYSAHWQDGQAYWPGHDAPLWETRAEDLRQCAPVQAGLAALHAQALQETMTLDSQMPVVRARRPRL